MDVLSRKLRAGPQVASHFLPVRPFGVQPRTPGLKSVTVPLLLAPPPNSHSPTSPLENGHTAIAEHLNSKNNRKAALISQSPRRLGVKDLVKAEDKQTNK